MLIPGLLRPMIGATRMLPASSHLESSYLLRRCGDEDVVWPRTAGISIRVFVAISVTAVTPLILISMGVI